MTKELDTVKLLINKLRKLKEGDDLVSLTVSVLLELPPKSYSTYIDEAVLLVDNYTYILDKTIALPGFSNTRHRAEIFEWQLHEGYWRNLTIAKAEANTIPIAICIAALLIKYNMGPYYNE